MSWLLRFLLPAALLLALAWWVGGLPGTVTAESGPYTLETSLPAGLLLLGLAAILVAVLLRVAGGIRRTPRHIGDWRRGRRRAAGEAALHQGIAALSVADAATAQARAVRAKTLLGETPLVLLLTAEAARLAGDAETAAVHFEKLTADKALGFAGHHGLLRHSLAVADHDKAAVHATTAARKFPGSAWVQKQRLHLAVAQKHWADGLAFTNDPAEIAALGSAAAQVADPRQGVKLAQAALRAVPGFAPALVAYAAALRALGKERAARGVLKNGFKGNPHPLIAAAYVAGFGTPIERAQAAQSLAAVAPAQGESALIQAQTALAADLPGEARRHAHDAIAAGMTDARPLAVLAALEGKPAPAAPVPGWICEACNTKSENWVPVCPHCQKLGGMAWRAPGTALAVLPPDRLLT